MIEDYFLPQPLPEKLKKDFSKNTIRLGEYAVFSGFIVTIPSAIKIKNSLWRKLSPVIGDFIVKGITPFPEKNFPVMLIIVPSWMNIRGSVGSVEGRVYDLSQFSQLSGRFIIVEKFNKIKLEKYILKEPPSLDSKKIYNIFDLSYSETSRDIMLSFFLSSGIYSNRIGGCTVTLFNSLSKYYASDFRELKDSVRKIHPSLNKATMKITLQYDEPIDVQIRPAMKIKYESLNSKKALKFYSIRKGKAWEKSAITDTTIKMEDLIGVSELPFIPYPEETSAQYSELEEYSMDIATYVLNKHIESPKIEPEKIENFKEKMLRKIEQEFPVISEAMKMGIIMDLANVNGFGEHIGRLIDSWNRLGLTDPFSKVLEIYITLFERIDDIMNTRIRKEISSLSERKRFDMTINRVLWELNVLKPNGWDFFYFQKKLEERGIYKNPEKILRELVEKGFVINKTKDLFLAIEKV